MWLGLKQDTWQQKQCDIWQAMMWSWLNRFLDTPPPHTHLRVSAAVILGQSPLLPVAFPTRPWLHCCCCCWLEHCYKRLFLTKDHSKTRDGNKSDSWRWISCVLSHGNYIYNYMCVCLCLSVMKLERVSWKRRKRSKRLEMEGYKKS